jgi:hypothetical protein
MVPAHTGGISTAQTHEMLKACLHASHTQRSEMDRSLILSHVRDQQALLEEERRNRHEAVNAAGRLAQELSESMRTHETHSAQAMATVQQLRGQLQTARTELHRVQEEGKQQIDAVVREAEARHNAALQAEQARVAQLAQENQRQTSLQAELEQQRIVCRRASPFTEHTRSLNSTVRRVTVSWRRSLRPVH